MQNELANGNSVQNYKTSNSLRDVPLKSQKSARDTMIMIPNDQVDFGDKIMIPLVADQNQYYTQNQMSDFSQKPDNNFISFNMAGNNNKISLFDNNAGLKSSTDQEYGVRGDFSDGDLKDDDSFTIN